MGSCCVQVLMLILRNEYIEHFFFLVSLGVCVCVCVYIYIYIYIYMICAVRVCGISK